MNLTNFFNTLTGAVGAWEWLTSLKPLYYIIIIGVLLVLTVGSLIFAIAKKARVRHNDVNVLLMLGDNEDSVDTSIFKKHYAMVLISKTDNATVAEPKLLQPIVQLSDNAEEIIEVDTVEDEEVIESENTLEETVIEDTVTDEYSEEVVNDNIQPLESDDDEAQEIEESVIDESFSDEMAVDQTEEEIPFAECAEEAEEASLDTTAIEEEIEPITNEEIIEETLDEVAVTDDISTEEIEEESISVNEFAVEESEDDIAEIEDIHDISEEDTESDIEVYDILYPETPDAEVFDNTDTVAPIIVTPNEIKVEEERPKTISNNISLYDIDCSENGDGDRIEIVTYLREQGVCKGSTELIEEESEQLNEETKGEPTTESDAEIYEEVMLIADENKADEQLVSIEENTESDIQEISDESSVSTEQNIEEIIAEEPIEEVDTTTEFIAETVEDSTVEDEVAAAAVEAIEYPESDNSISEELELQEVSTKSDEELAYTLVNAENALPEAVEATEKGEIIVDANGDGIAEEILVDKNILKSRYKTVDLETRLRRTEESVKGYYSEIKNFLLSYSGVKSRVSKKFDTFTIGRFIVAKMALRGNVINLYLALASESVEDKYFAEDVGDSETYGKTPTLHKVKSKRGCKYGIELIRDIMSELQIATNEKFVPTDYVALYPPEDIEEKKNEIRHLFKDSISVEDLGIMTDEESMEFIEIVKNKEYTINKFLPINKYVIFVDDLDMLYESGETVTINDLINKEALPKEENIFLEIRARGTLNRKLTVEAHSFDPNAIKMIILTDGKVIQYK